MSQSEGAQMTGFTVSERLHARDDQHTNAERKVVRVLTSEYPVAGLEPMARLAERARVSAPTVVRLISKLGYESYSDFQGALLNEVRERASDPSAWVIPESRGSGGEDDLHRGLAQLEENVRITRARISDRDLKRAVDLLSQVQRPLLTLGGIESDICAVHLAGQLDQVRSGVRHVEWNPAGVARSLVDVSKRYVIVAFDFRRYQQGTIGFVRAARRKGAAILLITDKWMSPAAEHSDVVLVCHHEGPGPFDSKVGAFALVECLVAGVVMTIGDTATERIAVRMSMHAGSTWAEGLLAGIPGDSSDWSSP